MRPDLRRETINNKGYFKKQERDFMFIFGSDMDKYHDYEPLQINEKK